MERLKLIATKSLKYAGVWLKPGDPFTATRAHARAFVKGLKKARYADEDPAPAPQPESATAPVPEPAPEPVADPDASPSTYETTATEAEPQVDDTKPKRGHRRKDMTARR